MMLMSDPMKFDEPVPAAAAPSKPRVSLPRWKAVLILAAAMLVLLGAVFSLVGSDAAAPAPAPGTQLPSGAAGLVGSQGGGPGTSPRTVPAEPGGSAAWSGGMLRMGFSFFVAFAVGYLMRVFVRISLIIVGAIVLVLTWFSYIGFITVNWQEMEVAFNSFVDRIGTDFDEFRTMLTGSLPQAGLGALGLVAGFKKR